MVDLQTHPPGRMRLRCRVALAACLTHCRTTNAGCEIHIKIAGVALELKASVRIATTGKELLKDKKNRCAPAIVAGQAASSHCRARPDRWHVRPPREGTNSSFGRERNSAELSRGTESQGIGLERPRRRCGRSAPPLTRSPRPPSSTRSSTGRGARSFRPSSSDVRDCSAVFSLGR